MAGVGVPLVGRERESATLDALLDGLGAGTGRFLLVSGDPGIGKSRLLAELVERAGERGVTVGSARALESVRTAPYALLAAAVEPVLGAPLTGWTVEGGGTPDAIPQARDDFFARLGSALAERVAARPRVLVFDDLHWADTPTLRYLEWQARAGVPSGLLVAGSYRPAAVQRGAPLTRLLGAVADGGAAERLELGGLDADAVAELTSATVGHPLDGDTLADLLDETRGNPLFVVEVARSHQTVGGAAGARRSPPLPGAVRESVYGRLDALPDESVAALGAAAVLGGEFDVAVLAAMLDTDEATVLAELAAAERAALVQPADGAWRYAFTHPLLCRVIYDGLTGGERARRHLAAAQAIESVSGNGEAQWATMAYHYTRAVPVGEVGVAIAHATRAATHAMANLAFEDAARFYSDALGLAERDAAVDASARAEMLLRRADALLGAGDTAGSRAGCAEAAALAATSGDGDRLARGVLGRAGYRGVPGTPDVEAIALMETAMANPADDPLLRARVSARLAMELYYLGERDRRDALSAAAVDLVRASGDGAVLAQVLISRHYAVDEVGNVAERSAVAAEAARVAEAAGDGETAMLAHYLLVRDRLEVGDRQGADAATERLRDLARSARQPLHPWRVRLLDALFAHLDGDVDRAEGLAMEAYAQGSAASIPNAAVALSGLLFLIRFEQRRVAELLEPALEARAHHPHYSTWGPMVAWCRLAAGDPAGARAEFAAALAGFDDLVEDEAYLPTSFALANVAVELGEVAAATHLLERLGRWADRVIVVAGPTACAGPVALVLGRLATLTGCFAQARDHLHSAAATAERLGSPLWAAHVTEATSALAAAEAAAPAVTTELTGREVEVLRLIAQGMTNREVAAHLQLGVRTIDSHVATMYRKVGARRRADAVAYGVANGLVDPPKA